MPATVIDGWDRLSLHEVLKLAGWTSTPVDTLAGSRRFVYDEMGAQVATTASEAWHALRARGFVGPLSCESRECWLCTLNRAAEVA